MPYFAFDIETARILAENLGNLTDHLPLGIACAAIAFSDRPTEFWQAYPQLSQEDAIRLVQRLQTLVSAGYQMVTWNGCSFDLRVLAHESGLFAECGELALNHIDLMAFVTFSKGHFLQLEKVLDGAGLAGKTHTFRLADGRVVDPSGANAPVLWSQQHFDAVLAYLQQDVEALLRLAADVARRHKLDWKTGTGRPASLPVPRMMPVRDCFRLSAPDTSWMKSPPPTRHGFVEWIPGCTLR